MQYCWSCFVVYGHNKMTCNGQKGQISLKDKLYFFLFSCLFHLYKPGWGSVSFVLKCFPKIDFWALLLQSSPAAWWNTKTTGLCIHAIEAVWLTARADKGFYSPASILHVQCLAAKCMHSICGLCSGAISIKSTALVQDVGAIVVWSWRKQLGQLSNQRDMCSSI